jgi:hypothetical protein
MADKRGGLTPGALGLVNQGEAALGTTFNISSGHRDADYNATLPGAAKNSDHLSGDAFDISTRGMSNAQAAQISDYYKGQSNTYVKDNYDDGHIHVSYRGPDNQMGHVNKGATDQPDPGQKNADGTNSQAAKPTDSQTPAASSTNSNGTANNASTQNSNQANQQQQAASQNSTTTCNPKVTGTGKPIGSSSSNSSSSGNNSNNSNNSNNKNNSDGKGGDKTASDGKDNNSGNQLKNDGQTNNIKYNKERADQIYDGLRDRGYTHEQSVAAMGHFYNESKFNTNITGDSGTSYGLGQWHNERGDALQAYASSTGRSANDVNTQLDFFDKEMRGSEASRAGNSFFNSTTIEGASAAMDKYERFKNYNVPGNFQSVDRLQNANTFNQVYAGRR